MGPSLKGPQAKVDRAKKHIHELESALGGLVLSKTTHPDVIVTENDPATGNLVYKIARVPCVPDQIAAIAGDAIHNLRSALDLLMTQLVERASGKSMRGRGTPYFIFDETRQGFEARCTPKVEALIGKDALDCIRAAEPYRGGKGEAAYYLHHLDVEDKHRVIYECGFNLSSQTLPFATPPPDLGWPPEAVAMLAEMMDTLFYKPSDIMFPLKAGDELFSGPAQPTNDPKFRLDVAFSEPKIVQAQPVLPSLTQYSQTVEALVNSFAPLF